MKDFSNYMGGTNISLERLTELGIMVHIDGGTMTIKDWFEEIEVFESLEIGKSKVFIPYGLVQTHGTLKRIEWERHIFKNYNYTEETEDWWYYKPILIVDMEDTEWIVYEYLYYEENKEVVHINRITPQTVEVFTPANRSMGFVNEYEFNDLRVQIATNELEGYYVLHDNEKLFISSDGHLSNWGTGMFDLMEIQISKMFQAGRGKKLKLK